MATKKKTVARKKTPRDAESTKANILAIAREEFANRGLHGARVESIAERTRTTKRMIYYYFAGGKARNSAKEQLYAAVLEQAYADIQQAEAQQLEGIEQLAPQEALRRIVRFSFDFYEQHPDFNRLVITENIHEGKHLHKLRKKNQFTPDMIARLTNTLERGRTTGVFQRQIDPVDLHLLISSLSFFRISNRHTFGDIFKQDLAAPANRDRHEKMLCDSVLTYLATPEAK